MASREHNTVEDAHEIKYPFLSLERPPIAFHRPLPTPFCSQARSYEFPVHQSTPSSSTTLSTLPFFVFSAGPCRPLSASHAVVVRRIFRSGLPAPASCCSEALIRGCGTPAGSTPRAPRAQIGGVHEMQTGMPGVGLLMWMGMSVVSVPWAATVEVGDVTHDRVKLGCHL